nr:hypothetical protein [Tanacetum cinerariifolium]
FLALGWFLEEIHMTWVHLEKKRTRLRTYTKSLEDLCIQWLETASQERFRIEPLGLNWLGVTKIVLPEFESIPLTSCFLVTGRLVNGSSRDGIDMVKEDLDLEPKIDARMRDFLDDKLHDKNAKESWALLEDLALYDNERWNDPRDFAKPVKAISLPRDVPVVPMTLSIAWEISNKPLLNMHPRVLTKQEIRRFKAFDNLADLGSCVNIISLYLFKKLNIGLLEDADHIFGLAGGTKSYPIGIVKDVEVRIGKLNLLNDFYVIDIKKDPETPLLAGRGFIETANAVINYRKSKIEVGEGITRSVFGVKGFDLGKEEAPYWTTVGEKES